MKIKIEPLLPTGNYLNKRYSIEMDFPDGSNPPDNFKYLNDIITAIHMSEYPLLYKEGKPLFSNYQGGEGDGKPVKEEKPVISPVDSMKEAIKTCTTVKALEIFTKMVQRNPELKEAYDSTMIKLTANAE